MTTVPSRFCTSCGHRLPTGARFCTKCGAPRAVPPDEQSPHEGPSAPGPRFTPLPPRPPLDEPIAAPTLDDDRTEAPRQWQPGPVRGALVAGGVIALALVATLVVSALGGRSGGARSPEGAVRALAAAVSAEDPAAALAVLNPDEVRAVGTLYSDVETRARALGYAPGGKTLGGLDLEFEGLTLRVRELGPDIARVTITGGALRYDVSRSRLARNVEVIVEGAAARRVEPGDPVPEPEQTNSGLLTRQDLTFRTEDPSDPSLLVVKRRDRWYVSPLYTVAEHVAVINGLPGGDFTEVAPGAATAETAEEAVRDLGTALATLDTDEIIDQLPGSELVALRSYRRAVAELLAGALEDDGVQRLQADVADLTIFPSKLDNRRVKATITRAEGSARWDDRDGAQVAEFTWDGTCLTISRKGRDDSTDCITQDTERLGVDSAFVVVVREGGRWRVSPLATALQYAEEMLPHIDTNLISRALRVPELVRPSGTASIGNPLQAELNDAGFARYDLPVRKGRRFTVGVSGGTDGGRSSAYLLDADGREVPLLPVIEPRRDGLWTLVVVGDVYGKATVRVALAPVLERPLTLGTRVRGTIAEPGQVVEYAFAAQADQEVSVDVDNSNLQVLVLDPAGDEVGPSASGGYLLEEPGTYRLRAAGDASTGNYSLTVAEVRAFVFGDGATDAAVGDITSATTFLAIDLLVRAGSQVVVTASAANRAMDLTVTVRGPDGSVATYDSTGPGGKESVRFTPEETTTFELEVSAVGATGSARIEARRA